MRNQKRVTLLYTTRYLGYNSQVMEEKLRTDQEIVQHSLTEKQSFAELINRYEQKLRRYVARLGVRTKDDQDDVLQNTFLKVYRNLNSYDPDLPFSSWIYRITRNEAISWYRQQRVRPEGYVVADSDEVLALVAETADSPEVVFDKALAAADVSRALVTLEEKYREVLILRYFEHKEYDEISDIMQIPLGSVGTLLYRGKKKLAAALNSTTVRSNEYTP